jgi:molybdenum cofactor biosynthesis protein B
MSTPAPQTATLSIGVISSSRSLQDDPGGEALTQALEKAGHKVLPRIQVDGSMRAIRRFILDAQDHRSVNVVVLVGGTGLAKFDNSYEAATGFFDKEIPGFAEALRGILMPQLRSKTLGLRAAGGVMGSLLIFVLPGDPAVVQVAGTQLIGPELNDLLAQIHRESPADEDIVEDVEAAPEPENDSDEAAAEAEEEAFEEEALPEGWMRQLQEMGGVVARDELPDTPAWLTDLAAANEVLNHAGGRFKVSLPQGDYVAFGFPDLHSPRSRVLLLGLGSPRGEILALHRWPMKTGICLPRVGGIIPHRGRMGSTANEVTGRDYPGEGRLFAVDSGTVFILDGPTVQAWNGKNRKDLGREASALASLLLRWSQR